MSLTFLALIVFAVLMVFSTPYIVALLFLGSIWFLDLILPNVSEDDETNEGE